MSDVIERKKLIEEIQLIAKELNKDKQNAEPDDSDLMLAVDNQLSAIWRIKGVINNQPQVQPIVRSAEEIARYLAFDGTRGYKDWLEWLTKKEV